MVLILFGCNSKTKQVEKIELTPSKGEVVAISLDEAVAKIEEKDTFVVVLSQTYCGHCMEFFSSSDDYTKEIGLTLYDVILDKEERTVNENMKIIQQYFSAFSATPTLYYVEEGKVIDSLNAANEEVTLDSYKQFLSENGIYE